MKTETKKMIYTIFAVILALGLGIGAILLSMLNVQASTEMMPGIEQILDEKSSETPFRILELVNQSSDAEIGYYISGQEPYLTQYTYTPQNSDGTKGERQTFSSIEEGLAILPTREKRAEFVEATNSEQVKNPLHFAWNADNPGTGSEIDYPLSFKKYDEKYFLSKTDDATKWKRVNFKENRKETLMGHYEENASGDGDYTKEEQKYYPIREDVDTDGISTLKYRENIKNFFYSDDTEASAPYQLSFETVKNKDIKAALDGDGKELEEAYDYNKGEFGYYENVYGELTSAIVKNIKEKNYTFPGENPSVANQSKDTDTIVEDDMIGGEEDGTENLYDISNAGTQEDPYIYRGQNIEEHPYYKYTLIGDLAYIKAKAEECAQTSERKDGDITLESDQYWYWTQETTNTDSTLKKEALYIVTGRQAVSENQVKKIPEDFTYDYYYKVKDVQYCCKKTTNGKESDPEAYTYYGWYYASHPSNEDIYIEVKDGDTTTATHYISEAQYTLTPGKGNYDFVEGSGTNDIEQSVELDHLFYQGGYTNHDWFKRYVFHLNPESSDEIIQKQFKNLSIKVDTKVISATSELPKLSDYDLVYVNGRLSLAQAENIASTTQLPAIINQQTADAGTSSEIINKAFQQWIDASLSNQEYVSGRIYFTNGDFINQNFYQKISSTDLDKYKEISNYIKSENNYREVIESGENGEKTEPLSEDISQARITEYIINYKYKRQTAHKDTVNVLDIEPASVNASLTENDVRTWLGQNGTEKETLKGEEKRGTIQNFCCQARTANGNPNGEGTNGGADKITDGNASTYWHSKWQTDDNDNTKYRGETPHYFEYKLSSQDSNRNLKGIHFVARKTTDAYVNGKPLVLTLEIHKKDGTTKTETARFSNTTSELNSWTEKDYIFSKAIKDVKYIKVIFTDTYTNETYPYHNQDFASCAEFSTLYTDKDDDTEQTTINITHMTSSEFVGHIDDINTEYDAIYFGDSYDNWSFLRNGDVDANGNKTSLYAHVGGVFGGDKDPENVTTHRGWNVRLMGLLNDDYSSGTQLRSSVKSSLPTNLQNKIGLMRGSGNDITKQQLKELNDFISSGYPVIIGNKFINTDGKTINTNIVDSSSYMYTFFNNAISSGKVNVMSKKTADEKKNLNFFFYLAKPEIVFPKGGMPPEPQRLNASDYTYNKEADQGLLQQNEDGLSYTFTIKNESEISTATATYNCKLFLDLNFDGNLSSNEEQSEYIQIQDASGNVVRKENGKYHLKLGKKYTLTRKIPKDYYKVITWKLQISNNANPSIRTSKMGFTKRKADKKQTINVLQIYPENESMVTWKLTDTSFTNMFKNVDDFNINITAITTKKYKTDFAAAKEKGENYLDQYQMVVLGFADGYGKDTISNANGEVNAIRKFIEDGKSVIFAHDTTSFINRDTDKVNDPSGMPGTWIWGYTLNTYLRASVGMDRYGITSDVKINVDGQETTVSKELKEGNDLSSDNSVYKAIQDKVSDMAYMFGNKNTTSLMTQGFSNNVLYHINGVQESKISTKVNEGAITQYPYYVPDKISTALTHSQYYQLALEEDSDKDGTNDIVVWYCLAHENKDGTNENYSKYYSESPNDTRNNYYFYSKGNVIYTGVGHQGGITEQERYLFANAIIAAANVTAVDPEATFLDNFDPVANPEEYRYYMPDRLKTSEVRGTSNILDGDNTFNIRVRDYNMVASNLNYKSNHSGSLTMELYIEDANGTKKIINGEEVKVTKLSTAGKVDSLKKYSDGESIKVSDGVFNLTGNDTFQFELKDMESYLKQADGYKKNCRIFARIESTVTLYGSTANKETWTSINLKPRQLFDLD